MTYLVEQTGIAHYVAEDGKSVCGASKSGRPMVVQTHARPKSVCGTCRMIRLYGAIEREASTPAGRRIAHEIADIYA